MDDQLETYLVWYCESSEIADSTRFIKFFIWRIKKCYEGLADNFKQREKFVSP